VVVVAAAAREMNAVGLAVGVEVVAVVYDSSNQL